MYIYQIELSNVCSLTCEYCPHPKQIRRKGFMDFETFRKCVALYKKCDNQFPLFLHNFGEVLLHPDLEKFIAYATREGVEVSFFTNGVLPGEKRFDRDRWKRLRDAGLKRVGLSAHAMSEAEFREITEGVVDIIAVWDPASSPRDDWAGQVPDALDEIDVPAPPVPRPCIFERKKAFVILWDGRLSTCCIDVEGREIDLHIDDILARESYEFRPISLCSQCECYVEKRL